MILADIIEFFRIENPEITTNRISDALLKKWCLPADKEVCAITRCIVGDFTFNSVVSTSVYLTRYDLTTYEAKFYDIDDYPGGGVSYYKRRLLLEVHQPVSSNPINPFIYAIIYIAEFLLPALKGTVAYHFYEDCITDASAVSPFGVSPIGIATSFGFFKSNLIQPPKVCLGAIV